MPESYGYSTGKFGLELEGEFAGFLDSVEGGEVFAEVAEEPAAPDGVIPKHLAAVKYEPIRIKFGAGMTEAFYQWIARLLARSDKPMDGAILFLDINFKEDRRLEWTRGRITEVTFPAFDASSKDTVVLTVVIAPESTSMVSSQSARTVQGALKTSRRHLWRASNFRFELSGLEAASKRVKKIDSFTVKMAAESEPEAGAPPQASTRLLVPNVLFTVPMRDAQPYFDWVEDFIVRGNNGQGAERSGALALLDTNLKDEQFRLTLGNVGIVRARTQRADASSEVVATIEVELYCESMRFTPSPDIVAGAQAAADTTGTTPALTALARSAPVVPAAELLLALLLARCGDDVQRSLAKVLQTESIASASPELRASLVAARLQPTRNPTPASKNPQREDGVALGERWASERAAFGELEQVAQLETGDWTALRLADEHTLIVHLQQAGLIPTGASGAFELQRDDFVEGVIAGAANVLRLAAPHLKQAKESPR